MSESGIDIIKLANVKPRRVATPEGAAFYGQPIGSIIMPDLANSLDIQASVKGITPPKGALAAVSDADMPSGGESGGSGKHAKPLKITVSESSLSGPKSFTVGDSVYHAPAGSKLIVPKKNHGVVYVLTPDKKVHAFNEAGEAELPAVLAKSLSKKFSGDLTDDPKYAEMEMSNAEDASTPQSLEDMKAGQVLVDENGVPQFEKNEDGDWEHVDFGTTLSSEDLQDEIESGELKPGTPDSSGEKSTESVEEPENSPSEEPKETPAETESEPEKPTEPEPVEPVKPTKPQEEVQTFFKDLLKKDLESEKTEDTTPDETKEDTTPSEEAESEQVSEPTTPEGDVPVSSVEELAELGPGSVLHIKIEGYPKTLDYTKQENGQWQDEWDLQYPDSGFVVSLKSSNQVLTATPSKKKPSEDEVTEEWLKSAGPPAEFEMFANGKKISSWVRMNSGWMSATSGVVNDPEKMYELIETTKKANYTAKISIHPEKTVEVSDKGISVGDEIKGVDDLVNLPSGAQLSYTKKNGTTSSYTKLENGLVQGPGGGVFTPEQLKYATFKVESLPEKEDDVVDLPAAALSKETYKKGDQISVVSDVFQFEVGTSVTSYGFELVKKEDGNWYFTEEGQSTVVTPDDLADDLMEGELHFGSYPGTASDEEDVELADGLTISKTDIHEAVTSLEAHTSFQIKYGLKAVPNNPIADPDNLTKIREKAQAQFPDLKPKQAFVAYLKDKAGIKPEIVAKKEKVSDAPKVRIGSKDPKKGVQGFDGGEFTSAEIQEAIDILEAFNGKAFKNELNKKNNALGALNPNDIVGFNKDKTVGKQKFIDLLKVKLQSFPDKEEASSDQPEEPVVETPTPIIDELNAPNVPGPVVPTSLEPGTKVSGSDLDDLNVGDQVTHVGYTLTKVQSQLWTYEDGGLVSESSLKSYADNGLVVFQKYDMPQTPVSSVPPSVEDKIEDPAVTENLPFEDIEIGAVYVNSDGDKFYSKVGENEWRYTTFDPATVSLIPTSVVKDLYAEGKISRKEIENPEYNKSGLVPGKYVSGGNAQMYVKSDGTGVFVNSKGTVSSLTANAVKKNYAAGMNIYAGDPDTLPVVPPKTKAKPKNVSKLEDGTYFAGDPYDAKTVVYEVSGDNVKMFKPKTVPEYKIGSKTTGGWMSQTSPGAAFKQFSWGKKLVDIHTKGEDGKWYSQNTGDPTSDAVLEAASYYYTDYKIHSNGLSDPVTVKKTKVDGLFSSGKLTDADGNSVIPEGYTGSIYLFGKETSVPSLAIAKDILGSFDAEDQTELDLKKKLAEAGVLLNPSLIKKKYFTSGETVGVGDLATALSGHIDSVLDGLTVEKPEGGAKDLFEWDEFGQATFPAPLTKETGYYSSISDLSDIIKETSAQFGDGKIIGQGYGKMSKDQKKSWIGYMKKGNFQGAYITEVNALASAGLSHPAGYLHPGYSGNEETNKIVWGPAVPGEISASKTIEGDWTTAYGVQPSLAEIDNYLIKAHMQNPTFLSNSEKREWVAGHKNENQSYVDKLSVLAKNRKDNGQLALSDPPVWTDDVKPAKSYDFLFDDKPFPTEWTKQGAEEYYDDHVAEIPELEELYTKSETESGSAFFAKMQAVTSYFKAKDEEYQAELLKPVYSKEKKLAKGTHDVWLVKDQFDNKYVFKSIGKGSKQRAMIEHKSNQLAKFFGFSAPQTDVINLDGEDGLLQSFIPNVSSFEGIDAPIKMSTLDAKQLSSVAKEHVLDWILDNDDTHADNLLLTENGGVAGIDKGRSFFTYGNWNGLSTDYKANTNAQIVYNKLYDGIRDGSIPKDNADAAYISAMKAAQKVQKADWDRASQLVLEGLEGRTKWASPGQKTAFTKVQAAQNAEQLIEAFKLRKENMVSDIGAMWEKVYKDAGLELPEMPQKEFENHFSGWSEPELIEAVGASKVWGTAPMHANSSVVGGSSLLWEEENSSGDKEIHGQLKVGAITQQKLVDFFQTKVTFSTYGNSSSLGQSSVDADFPNTMPWKKIITGAAKDATKKVSTKDFDQSKWDDLEELQSMIAKDVEFYGTGTFPEDSPVSFPSGFTVSTEQAPVYRMMLDHYDALINKTLDAKKLGQVTNKYEFTYFDAPKVAQKPKVYTSPEGATYTELVNGQYLKSDGALVTQEALPSEAKKEANGWKLAQSAAVSPAMATEYSYAHASSPGGTLEKNGLKKSSSEESIDGHEGYQVKVKLPTGEVIRFRNASSTHTNKSQQGLVSFSLTDDYDASLARVQDYLDTAGLGLEDATEDDAETIYWRQMFDLVIDSNTNQATQGIKKAKDKLVGMREDLAKKIGIGSVSDKSLVEAIGLSMSAEEEKSFWHDLAVDTYGADTVDAWLSEGNHMPQYHHMDLSDPEKNTGLPYYKRIDSKTEELQKKGALLAIGNSGKDNSLLNYITSGGMISTEERLRILGYFKNGASSSSDQGTGGATGVFTRISVPGGGAEFSGAIYGKHVAYWNVSALDETASYSFSGDLYGNTSKKASESHYNNAKNVQAHTNSGNEALIQNSLSIFDHLEIYVFEDPQKRNEAIQRMKELGIKKLRGLDIEDRFVMRVNLQEALDKVRAQWK